MFSCFCCCIRHILFFGWWFDWLFARLLCAVGPFGTYSLAILTAPTWLFWTSRVRSMPSHYSRDLSSLSAPEVHRWSNHVKQEALESRVDVSLFWGIHWKCWDQIFLCFIYPVGTYHYYSFCAFVNDASHTINLLRLVQFSSLRSDMMLEPKICIHTCCQHLNLIQSFGFHSNGTKWLQK